MAKERMNPTVAIRTQRFQFITSAIEGQLQISKSAITFKSSSPDNDMSWPKKELQVRSQLLTGYLQFTSKDNKRYWISTYTKRWNLYVGLPLLAIYLFLLNWSGTHPTSTLSAMLWLLLVAALVVSYAFHYLKFLDIRRQLQQNGYLTTKAKGAPSSSV
jgi:hypothetical protein